MPRQTTFSPHHKFLLGPRHKFLLAPGVQVTRPSIDGCSACGAASPAAPVIDLGDKEVLLELKTMMVLHTPSLADQGEAWFSSAWSSKDWESYKAILAKLPGSAGDKAKLVAHQGSGGVVLGMPPAGGVGFPSIYGIAALGNRLVQLGTMTHQSLETAFPKLTAAGKAAATGLKPGDAGVASPSQGASALPLGWIAVGVGVAAIGAYLLLKKR